MSEQQSKASRLGTGGGDANPAARPGDERAAAAGADDATARAEVRRFLSVVIVTTLIGGAVNTVAAIATDNPRWMATGVIALAVAMWLAAFPRRAIRRKSVEGVVSQVAIVMVAAIIGVTLAQPFLGLVLAPATLVPVAVGLPYLEGRRLRGIMILGWAAAVIVVLESLLPDGGAIPGTVVTFVRVWALVTVTGLIFFLFYRSAVTLKASEREFRRLFELSSDLAESTDPGVLGGLVARHLAEATGFDDCVIYALAPETNRFAPFGSHPPERSLTTDPESLAMRPVLERVTRDRAPVEIDVSDANADPLERKRLRTIGRQAMLLIPLTAQERPVGVVELTSAVPHSIDERLLALARTLTFEAAMAIENGRLYQELRHRSLHDPLTGLANRSLLFDRAEHALARLDRQEGAGIAVLFMDLDGFKMVNDTLGHARGDRMLTLIGERLQTVVRAADTVARLGGDEFALLLEDVSSVESAVTVAARAHDILAEPFDLAGQAATISASIGVSVRPALGAKIDDLLKDADAAMYEAKAAGKGRTVLSARSGIGQDPGVADPTAG